MTHFAECALAYALEKDEMEQVDVPIEINGLTERDG